MRPFAGNTRARVRTHSDENKRFSCKADESRPLSRLIWASYIQTLRLFHRGGAVLTNFGVSFCILSFPTGVTGSFATAWFWGGPVTAVWGWLLVSTMICGFVGVAMAEICSSCPTSGGLYYWRAALRSCRLLCSPHAARAAALAVCGECGEREHAVRERGRNAPAAGGTARRGRVVGGGCPGRTRRLVRAWAAASIGIAWT